MQNVLIGKIINSIKISSDKMSLLFVTDADEIIAKCDAECCSHTWVEHVELPALGFPALVISADDLELNKPDESNEEHECLAFYGFKIVTDKGEIVIDYRNSSNGYYGGSLSWPDDEYFYGGVGGKNVSSNEWIDIAGI